MNPTAEQVHQDDSAAYPVGSVVVKEKHELVTDGPSPDGLAVDQASSTAAIAGMIKRAPGYDPDHGDWEYFYYENNQVAATGRLSNCIDCHTYAADRDYVFGRWPGL